MQQDLSAIPDKDRWAPVEEPKKEEPGYRLCDCEKQITTLRQKLSASRRRVSQLENQNEFLQRRADKNIRLLRENVAELKKALEQKNASRDGTFSDHVEKQREINKIREAQATIEKNYQGEVVELRKEAADLKKKLYEKNEHYAKLSQYQGVVDFFEKGVEILFTDRSKDIVAHPFSNEKEQLVTVVVLRGKTDLLKPFRALKAGAEELQELVLNLRKKLSRQSFKIRYGAGIIKSYESHCEKLQKELHELKRACAEVRGVHDDGEADENSEPEEIANLVQRRLQDVDSVISSLEQGKSPEISKNPNSDA